MDPSFPVTSNISRSEVRALVGKNRNTWRVHAVTHRSRERYTHDGVGWSPLQMHRFLNHNRDWKPILGLYRKLLQPESSLKPLGLCPYPYPCDGPDDHWAAGEVPLQEVGLALESSSGARKRRKKGSLEGVVEHTRETYKMRVAYYGPSYDGWMHQSHLNSIEGAIRKGLLTLMPPEVAGVTLSVAGRTDKGVHAWGQVVSFYSWRPLAPSQISQALNLLDPTSLSVHNVQRVPRSFHATFSAKWRRYLYLLPLRTSSGRDTTSAADADPRESHGQTPNESSGPGESGVIRSLPSGIPVGVRLGGEEKEEEEEVLLVDGVDVNPEEVHRRLQLLEGQALDYYAFARDTPQGKDCVCTLHRATARLLMLPCKDIPNPDSTMETRGQEVGPLEATRGGRSGKDLGRYAESLSPCSALHEEQDLDTPMEDPSTVGDRQNVPVLCIDLVANRFLRRMVRVLVSTAVRESIPGAARFPGQEDALIRLMQERQRNWTAVPAPPEGLCFVDVGYDD